MDYAFALDRLATTDQLLVVSDFDGTLTGFAADIYAVTSHPDSLAALERLARLPRTTVAALSGRHLDGLKQVFPLRAPVLLGGSHGAETEGMDNPALADAAAKIAAVDERLEALSAQHPGTYIEYKPVHRVFHALKLSQRDPDAAARALGAALRLEAPGLHVTEGKNVVEFSASTATKGSWIAETRRQLGATGVVFLGDDVTDETGFRALDPATDVGVKVGEGDTAAQLRVADIDAVAAFLTELADRRTGAVGRS